MNLRLTIENLFARLIRYSFVARTNSNGFDQVQGWSADEPYSIPVRRLQWYGFRSRPPVNSEAIFLANNGSRGDKVLVAADNTRYGPSAQEDEEVEVYSSKGQRVILAQDGSLTLSTSSGAQAVLTDITTVPGDLKAGHYQGDGGLPVAVPGPALGMGGSVFAFGTDASFSLVCGCSSPGAAGPLATVTFARHYTTTPNVGISFLTPQIVLPDLPLPIGLGGKIIVTPSNTNLIVSTTAAVVPVGTYSFSIVVIGS